MLRGIVSFWILLSRTFKQLDPPFSVKKEKKPVLPAVHNNFWLQLLEPFSCWIKIQPQELAPQHLFLNGK